MSSQNWSDFQDNYGKEGRCAKVIDALKGSSDHSKERGLARKLSNSSLLMMAATVGGESRKSGSSKSRRSNRSPVRGVARSSSGYSSRGGDSESCSGSRIGLGGKSLSGRSLSGRSLSSRSLSGTSLMGLSRGVSSRTSTNSGSAKDLGLLNRGGPPKSIDLSSLKNDVFTNDAGRRRRPRRRVDSDEKSSFLNQAA